VSGFEELVLRDGERQLGAVVTEWRALAASIAGSSYFQTPDWVLGWWEDCGRPPTLVGLWRNASGRLEAVAALSKVREPLRRGLPLTVPIVTNSGSGWPHSADRGGWPALPHRVAEVRGWAAQRHWPGSVVVRHIDHRTGVACIPIGAHLVLNTRCPVLERADHPVEPVRSKRFAKKLRRLRRRLDGMGVSFAWTPPERMTSDAVDLLFALLARARRPPDESSFTPDLHAGLQRRLVAASSPGCGPAMVVAVHDGVPIGIEYGFVWRDTFYDYQSAWDASYAHLSLGTVLNDETIRLAAINGFPSFDFLRGGEFYKYRLGASDVLDETWLLRRGLSGPLLEWKYRRALADQARDEARGDASRPRSDDDRVIDLREEERSGLSPVRLDRPAR
jgi:CelD/BcsL family acetyltransferase involved in cellulose biosynthesis